MEIYKVAWIIGANSDIAKNFVNNYGTNFEKIILASKDINKLNLFASTINHNDIETYSLDISNLNSINSFINTAITPDVVIMFSGHIKYENSVEADTEENIEQTFETNLEGPVQFFEKTKNLMKKREKGIIVALSSCAGERGKSSNRFYSASKAGLTNYLQGLMQENEKYGIKTIIIKLGHVNTKMLKNIDTKKQLFSCSCDDASKYIMSCIVNNRSKETYYTKIWKPLSLLYKVIPTNIYKKMNF